MNDADISDMEEYADYRVYLDKCKMLSASEIAVLTEQMERKWGRPAHIQSGI